MNSLPRLPTFMFLLVTIFLYCVALPVHTHAQEITIANRVDSLFSLGEFEAVELEALRLGDKPDTLASDLYADVQVIAGFAMIMLEREADAREYFRRALHVSPELRLDPVTVSPKFRVVFDEVRESFLLRPTEPILQSRMSPKISSTSRVMNLVVPGSGYLREGELVRGAGWIGLQAASSVWFVVSLASASDSREHYLAQSEPQRIRDAYRSYNDDHRLAWTAGIATAAIYLLCQIDLALFEPASPEQAYKISFGPVRNGVGLTFSL